MLENDFTHTDSNVASGSRNTHLSPSFEIFDLEDESHPTPNGHVNSTQVTSGSGSGSGSGEKLKHRSKPTRSMINPQATHLKQHPERGNGVFATHPIAPGSVIEESPVLIITKDQWDDGKMDDCILGEYGFCWRGGAMGIGLGSGKIFPVNDKKVQDVNPGSGSWSTKPKPDDDQVRLVTELASLFNHSSSPNVNYVRDFEKSVIRFTASRAIQPGEELCICYAADESKLWFINSDEKRQRSEGSEEEAVIFPPEELVELLDGEADEERRAAEEKKIARQKRLEMMKGVPREAGRREMKKAKFFEKRKAAQEAEEAKLNGIEPKVIAPTPIRPPPSASTSTSSTPSRINTPLYPAIPERTVESPSLPPPLHSTKGKSRHEHDGPVILTPELEWDDQTSADGEEEWAGIERIKGFTEREEDEALENDSALMDVWVVNVYEPTIVREVLRFSKERLRSEPELKHIKRVCRRRNAEGVQEEMSRVALCSVTEMDHQTLSQSISEFSPVLASLDPYIVSIPKTPAHDQSQLITKHAIWPVTLAPFQRKQDSSPRFWSLARRKWVEAGIKRVIQLGLEAQSKGELPTAVYCTSPPVPLWPREEEGFVPPTPGLRASSCDTRNSENHPLRHAILNCIASIARLRTVPPFSDIQKQATRNGADYLLTSLSLFTLHEPCTMCTMALLHSRVREVFYVFPSGQSGGFEGDLGVHSRKDLNHRFEVWKWKDVDLTDEERGLLSIPPGVEV